MVLGGREAVAVTHGGGGGGGSGLDWIGVDRF